MRGAAAAAHLQLAPERLAGAVQAHAGVVRGDAERRCHLRHAALLEVHLAQHLGVLGLELGQQVLHAAAHRGPQLRVLTGLARLPRLAPLLLDDLRHLVATDGGVPCFGRSTSYRFAYVAPVVLGQLLGFLDIAPGEARTLCSGALKFFLDQPVLTDAGHQLLANWLAGLRARAAA